jgi:hypothetical protein
MTPSELRIDSWVNYKGVDVQLTAEDFPQLEQDIEDKIIKPLQLTEPWFKALGYKRHYGDVVYIKYFGWFHFNKKSQAWDTPSTVRFLKKPLKYVHELQNLKFV